MVKPGAREAGQKIKSVLSRARGTTNVVNPVIGTNAPSAVSSLSARISKITNGRARLSRRVGQDKDMNNGAWRRK